MGGDVKGWGWGRWGRERDVDVGQVGDDVGVGRGARAHAKQELEHKTPPYNNSRKRNGE